MRVPALILASVGNGYQILYKSRAFDSLNPNDLDKVCNRMDGFKFDGNRSFFVTQSLGKIVVGKSTIISKQEYGDMKIKITHCYFMSMGNFIDIVRGYRRQGAVIATFKEHLRQDYDESVENISFVKQSMAEEIMSTDDMVDTVISLGMVDQYKKYMFNEVNAEEAIRVLFECFPANFIANLSILTNGEPVTNDMNVLFGNINVISDNRIISVHTAAKGISNISTEIKDFVTSPLRNYITEVLEHVDRNDNGFLPDLVSVTRAMNEFYHSGVIGASTIIKLMDKAKKIEEKMSIYGLIIEARNKLKGSKITNSELLEKYWAFVLYTSIVSGDKKNAALVHNVCTNQKGIDRERYLSYVKEAIELKCQETSDDDIALLLLISHEKAVDKNRLINKKYDLRLARAFLANRVNIGERKINVDNILQNLE